MNPAWIPLAVIALSVGPVQAAPPQSPLLVGVLHEFVKTAEATDSAAFSALFVRDASITDTLAPYHWQGPGSAEHYHADLQAALKSLGWQGTHLAFMDDPFVVAGGGYAYASLPLRMEYRVNDSRREDEGIFTLSLRHDADRWRITSATWTYTKPPS